MNKRLQEKIAHQELQRRQNEIIVNVLESCLPYQLEFIMDPHKRKAVCGTRRAAKSFMLALYLINQAITVPKSKCIYMGLTNESCKQIMWSDIVEVIFDKYKIKAECNSKYEIEFDNGSVIFLRGLDATPHQMSRLRGNKFDIAVIDEIQDFTQDIEALIDGVLKMSLAQTGATLCLGGTPGNHLGKHYWWQVNKPDTKLTQWKLFHFKWQDNTSIEPKNGLRVCDAIRIEIEKDIEINPQIINTPKYRQEVLGEWVVDTDARVYKSSQHNYIKTLPPNFANNAIYNLQMDLGFEDGTPFVITAYNRRLNNKLYVLESKKLKGLTISQINDEINKLKLRFKFQHMFIDAGAQGKTIVETLKREYNQPLEAAEKLGKEGHIALLNSDLILGNIQIIESENQDLIHEMETLIWDRKQLEEGNYKENQSMENDLCDALLYGHHASRHYWFRAPEPEIPVDEKVLQDIEKQLGMNKTKMKRLTKPFWEQ